MEMIPRVELEPVIVPKRVKTKRAKKKGVFAKKKDKNNPFEGEEYALNVEKAMNYCKKRK